MISDHDIPTPIRLQAKSVTFGENRISVFLRDPTTIAQASQQALEEVVRLALELEEEQRQKELFTGGGGATVSDSEATLGRQSGRDEFRHGVPERLMGQQPALD